jgi:hypothetical protein
VALRYGYEPNYPELPPHAYIYDGWEIADTAGQQPYTLPAGDGAKTIFAQLMDLAGNISAEPGWPSSIILDTAAPCADIASPASGAYINDTVAVCGYAGDENFDRWTLECKEVNASQWSVLNSDTTRQEPGGWPYRRPMVVHHWNTATVPNGQYDLRLTSTDLAANSKADTHAVYVSNGPGLPAEAITAGFITFDCLPVDADCGRGGNIHITDTQANQVWEYTPDGDSVLCFGYRSTGQDTTGFNQPVGIAVDDSGFTWVADCYNAKVKKFNPDGTLALSFGDHGSNPGQFNQPTGIAVKAGLRHRQAEQPGPDVHPRGRVCRPVRPDDPVPADRHRDTVRCHRFNDRRNVLCRGFEAQPDRGVRRGRGRPGQHHQPGPE